MLYKLIIKKMGVNAKPACTFSIPDKIVACIWNGEHLVFGTAQALYYGRLDGRVDKAAVVPKPDLLAMAWFNTRGCCICKDISQIYSFDQFLSITPLLGTNISNYLRKQTHKIQSPQVDLAMYNDNEICLCVTNTNAIYRVSSYDAQPVIRAATSGYSVASPIEYSRFARPSSICEYNGDIFVADTGNHCIRAITKNGITILYQDNSISPSSVMCCRNMVYFVSNNDVYTCNRVGNRITNIYHGNGRLLLVSGGDMLYILEEQNA